MSSRTSPHLISEREPSLQSSRHKAYHDPYIHLNDVQDEDEEGVQNLKFSLAHYFSPIFVVFIAVLLIATIVLFIWSNTSDGAWVSLQVSPILPSDSAATNAWIPFIVSFASTLKSNDYLTTNSLSSVLINNDYHSIATVFDDYERMVNSTESATIPNLSDLSLNLNICFVLCFYGITG